MLIAALFLALEKINLRKYNEKSQAFAWLIHLCGVRSNPDNSSCVALVYCVGCFTQESDDRAEIVVQRRISD